MFIHFQDRGSDSPFVEKVWQCRSEHGGTFSSIAASTWEMVVSKYEGATSLTVRGPETYATSVECPAEGEWFSIRFKLGTYMTLFPPGELIDRNDVVLPDAGTKKFWLQGSALEYPNFENAEMFVDRLVNKGLVSADPLVIRGETGEVSTRTAQRRFLQTTGMTRATIEQIERARRATLLLKQGLSILDVVFETGYYDQAHLTRSLKHYVGQTPTQIIRSEQQLSFLYKTDLLSAATV